MTKRPTISAVFCLLLATVAFYWQILLTRQFSLLTESEGVHQAYSWFNFWVASIKRGILPLWDPYTFAGHSFAGEMQTAVFYPLNLLLTLFPFNRQGVFPPQLYHQWYAFAHFLGACFMFALAREMRLSRFSSIVAGICFSFGGFVVHVEWPGMLQSAIWLPLIFLFLLRALRAASVRRTILYSSVSGLSLGLAILAGQLHVAIMQTLVVLSAAGFAGFHPRAQGEELQRNRWVLPAVAAAVALTVAFCAGAVQLFPSMEYSGRAFRFLGVGPPLPATQKIPYAYVGDGLWPHAFASLLLPFGFNGNMGAGETINAYLGVFPLLAAIVALRRCWSNLWIRYLAGLAAVAFLYSMGSYSLLHGALYAVVPRLWMAWEADRFVYLADFALAILAGFGVEALLHAPAGKEAWDGIRRVFTWVAIAGAVALAVPGIYGRPDINPWISFSLLMIFLSYGLFQYIVHGHHGAAARLLVVALILFDLSAFDWAPRNLIQQGPSHTNHLDRLLSCKGAANFLKSRPGPFRVRILTDPQPNIGDVFGVPTLSGRGTTLTTDTLDVLGNDDLLNARYILRPASAGEPGAAYQDAYWKVYENPGAYGGAWIVHETILESSHERLLSRLNGKEIDPRRQALIGEPLDVRLALRIEGANEDVSFRAYGPNRLELTAHASSPGLLVLSEFYYPGWRATVNGKEEPIYRVDGVLRGIAIPPGESRVVVQYAPRSVLGGAALSLAAFLGVPLAFSLFKRRAPFSS
ncbi:MAG: YfhO family protein [Bryobacteraceae bacterium]|jgi:hypothetical protein